MGNVNNTTLNALPKSHLGIWDTFRVGSSGLRSRRLRSALSALGITIGIAALVGVLGLSESGSADLMKELDALGTNLLTVESEEGFRSNQNELPRDATAMITRIPPVYEVASIGRIEGGVFINDLVDDGRTKGITIIATDLSLLAAQRGSIAAGTFLSETSSRFQQWFWGLLQRNAWELGMSLVSNEFG